MHREVGAIVSSFVFLGGCEASATCSEMAFATVTDVTRIEVKWNDGRASASQVVDPKQIASILTFVKARSANWYAPWYGVPVGQIHTEMYQGAKFVADFAVGRDFFEAQGCGYFYIRKASPNEVRELLNLLGISGELK